jgi:Tfp pilus assembly protein PilN
VITLRKATDEVVGTGPVRLPRVNLLPPEIEEIRRFRRVQVGLAGGVVAAVAVVGLLYVGATGGVTDAEAEVTAATTEQSGLQAEAAKYRDVTATYNRAAAAQAMLVAAMGEEVRYSRFLNDLALTMPDDVWITSLAYSQGASSSATPGTPAGIGTVTVSGVAFQHEDVATWLESVAGQEGYAVPQLQASTEQLLGTKQVVNWSMSSELTPDSLSGRYVKAGG